VFWKNIYKALVWQMAVLPDGMNLGWERIMIVPNKFGVAVRNCKICFKTKIE
jgi:hypothetical protein